MTAVLTDPDVDRNAYQGEHVADEDTRASFHIGACPGGCEECGTAPLSGPPCVMCGRGVPSGAAQHDGCRPLMVAGHVITSVTIVSGAGGWFVVDVDNDHLHWEPATTIEVALSPDAFAALVAARLGAVYLPPKPLGVPAACRSCGGDVGALRTGPVPGCCYWCARGAVTADERAALLESDRVGTLGSLRWSDTGDALLDTGWVRQVAA